MMAITSFGSAKPLKDARDEGPPPTEEERRGEETGWADRTIDPVRKQQNSRLSALRASGFRLSNSDTGWYGESMLESAPMRPIVAHEVY